MAIRLLLEEYRRDGEDVDKGERDPLADLDELDQLAARRVNGGHRGECG